MKSKEGRKNGGNCCYWNINIHNYNIDYVPVKLVDVANFVKKVPLEYIDTINANIHDSFIEYALPLIQGEPTIRYENGFPKFAKLNKIIIKK